MTSHSRNNYYQQHKNRLQEQQRQYEYKKYNEDNEHRLIKRYQSRINNHFPNNHYKAEDLLSCSRSFFKTYIEFCLRDTNRATMDLALIDLHHVTPVNIDVTNLTLWHWSNILPVTEEENLKIGTNIDKQGVKTHKARVLRFLHTIQLN